MHWLGWLIYGLV
jgi:hypothetical protein